MRRRRNTVLRHSRVQFPRRELGERQKLGRKGINERKQRRRDGNCKKYVPVNNQGYFVLMNGKS